MIDTACAVAEPLKLIITHLYLTLTVAFEAFTVSVAVFAVDEPEGFHILPLSDERCH